jgi:hypothetical protein
MCVCVERTNGRVEDAVVHNKRRAAGRKARAAAEVKSMIAFRMCVFLCEARGHSSSWCVFPLLMCQLEDRGRIKCERFWMCCFSLSRG